MRARLSPASGRGVDLRRARRRLCRATAARCRGRTLVVGAPDRRLAKAVARRGLEVTEADALPHPSPSGDPGRPRAATPGTAGPYGTLVLLDVLQGLPEAARAPFLARAWELLRPGGRLIAVVPNPEAERGPGGRAHIGRRALRTLLRALGRPRLLGDQPYRWLSMEVRKGTSRRGEANPTRRARYRTTARLCRGRVIELGCGAGHLAATIAARGLEVVGVDHSEEKVRAAREAYPGIAFVRSDIRTLGLPSASFDTAVLAEVLEHVPEDAGAEFLATAWRLLRTGGRLVVSVPNEDSIPHRNHLRRFDRRKLGGTLRPFGKPRLVVEQPFKWLMMYVEKRA